jgi:hypothetical protein
MPQTQNLNKPVWFLNPWFDILILTSLPFVFLVPLLKHLYVHIPHMSAYLYFLVNVPHVFSGLAVTYISEKAYKKNPILYIVVPLAIVAFFIAGFKLRYLVLMVAIRSLWGALHDFSQQKHILNHYKYLNQDTQRFDKTLDTSALAAVVTYGVIQYISLLSGKMALRLPFFLPKHVSEYLAILIWVVIGVFLARQVYLFLWLRKMYIFKIFFILKTFVIYFVFRFFLFIDMYLRNDIILLLHNKQYVGWVWLYFNKQYRNNPPETKRILPFLAQNKFVPLYLLLLLSLALLAALLMSFSNTLMSASTILASLHFYLDSFVWKSYSAVFTP